MKARNWGRIINIASAHGLVASAQKSAYVAAKHGIVGLTKVVALETATHRRHLQRDLPRLGAHAAGAEADRRPRRARTGATRGGAPSLVGEKQPSMDFVTPTQIGDDGGVPVLAGRRSGARRGLNMDGGWTAQ